MAAERFADVARVPQDDGPTPVVAIAYDDACKEASEREREGGRGGEGGRESGEAHRKTDREKTEL